MTEKTYKPANIIIKSDEENRHFTGHALTFYNFGTWLVLIDDIPVLPGGSLNEALSSEKIKHNYQIRFIKDLQAHPICTSNPSILLGVGKYLICRLLIKSNE